MTEVEHAPNWLLRNLDIETFDHLINIATLLWGIWMVRNKRLWEGKWVSRAMAVEWSLKQIND